MPITLDDGQYFGSTMKEICDTRLSMDEDGWYARLVPFTFDSLLK
jgi:hypothetical protein